jgi:hypothetical protein
MAEQSRQPEDGEKPQVPQQVVAAGSARFSNLAFRDPPPSRDS